MPEATHHQPAPLPRFFWQAVLILLPVVVLAALGFWAIRRDRGSVEQDARREILQSIPADFGKSVAEDIFKYRLLADHWTQSQRALAEWPGNRHREQTGSSDARTNDVGTWGTALPNSGEATPPMLLCLDTNGGFANVEWFHDFDMDQPPEPPAWLLSLTPAQRQLWTAISRADDPSADAQNLVPLVRDFSKTDPPDAARANAEFIQLRAESRTKPPAEAIASLLQFYGVHFFNAESESGLPVSQLALIEALRRARSTELSEALWGSLETEVENRPTILIPGMLDEAEQDIANQPKLAGPLAALRTIWNANEPKEKLAGALALSGKLNADRPAHFWLAALGQRWLCLSEPEATLQTALSNGVVVSTSTNHWILVTPFPLAVVEQGFVEAFRAAKITLPEYLGVSLELAGEPIPLPPPWEKQRGASANDLLLEEQFEMSVPETHEIVDPRTGQRQESLTDAMPSHPRFMLRVHLVNRSQLFARQHQRQFIFGSLIALSALTVAIGFARMLGAFRREQQLGGLKSNFVSSVSHELRAPIASIRLMAENLERGKIPDPRRQGEYFRFIVQECRRLSALVENVLDFSRIEQGRKEYEFEPTDLVALVQTTVTLMEPYAAEKGVPLQLEAGGGEPAASGFELAVDGRALQQALVNLIDNAIKHSPKGEPVTVKLARQPRAVTLEVADRGPGIPRAEQERIFERFYRRGSELRRETRGIGIGLSIVKHIVEAHGGRVRVQSAPDQGSRFALELPAAPPHE